MAFVIEKSTVATLSESEYDLLQCLRLLVCSSGILNDQVEIADTFTYDEGNMGDNIINDKFMFTVVDKALGLEREIDKNLMELTLVDITGPNNFPHKFKIISGSIEGGTAIQTNNVVIEHIYNSKSSYKLVNKIIKMKSSNFLKPFQLYTVMTYVETQYHSNDGVFLKIMSELLNIIVLQIRQWKDERAKAEAELYAEWKLDEMKLGKD